MTDGHIPQILHTACRLAGVYSADARLLRAHSHAVYVVDRGRTVVRVGDAAQHGLRARVAVTVTHRLAELGLPVTEPLIHHPIRVGGALVTFWRYYPQHARTRPPARELGRILRQLHSAPAPPVPLPEYVPLAGLAQILNTGPRVLPTSDRHWLSDRTAQLVEQYRALDSVLGTGLVHGDAYPGNTLWDGDTVRLGDWDEAGIAPRELDLVNTYQGIRFGHSEHELREFGLAYGWDVRGWAGFPVLRAMRDLHTLSAYIRRAESGDTAAAAELGHRIRSLRQPGNGHDRWHSVA